MEPDQNISHSPYCHLLIQIMNKETGIQEITEGALVMKCIFFTIYII